jgi:prepilin-type N-terminal cleavage/methylation domain-containing protein
MGNKQRGFSLVEILIVLVIVCVVGFIGWRVFLQPQDNKQADTNSSPQTSETPRQLIWQQTADAWQATETPPACPAQPMLHAPADLSKVTSVLYPGQTRGMYKPHGGLRFDGITDNAIAVTAPFDGFIVKASRGFAEGTTEIQYSFDIMHNCGVMTRLGHLRELPANLQSIVDTLPKADANSRIENVNPPVYVKQGEVLATKVGLMSEKNTFFDWGVYDYRQQNDASKSAAYQSAHPQKEHAWYAVCWLKDWLPADDVATLARLSAGGGESGKTSDYCI